MNPETETPPKYNLMDVQIFTDPFSIYNPMRENDPVYKVDPLGGWLVTRHEDVTRVFKDPKVFSADRMREVIAAQFPDANMENAAMSFEVYTTAMLFRDAPDHTRIRSYANKGFIPKAMERYRILIEEVVDDLLNKALEKGSMDAQTEFATALPSIIIAEIIGIPREDRDLFQKWTEDAILFFGGGGRALENIATCEQSMRDFVEYMEKMIVDRRKTPRDDLLSYMIAGEDSGVINDREMCFQTLQITAAGHITTLDMLGSGILTFLQNPEELDKLKKNPDLLNNSVEEVLRYWSPVQMTHRLATEDVELSGTTIKKGDLVYPVIPAANRDPRVFENPDEFRIDRPNANRHIAFGGGPHMCIGANLSRMEGQIAFRELFKRMPNLRLDGDFEWKMDSPGFRGLKTLPVAW